MLEFGFCVLGHMQSAINLDGESNGDTLLIK